MAEPIRAPRRRRRTPRGVPEIVEEREQRPFILGYGTGLTRREREQLKERIALFAGIAIALIVAAIIGWGVLEDNVIKPNQLAAANSKPVATLGNYAITTGFFKALENFTHSNLLNQQTQLNQQLSSLQASPGKNRAQIAQIQQQLSTISGQLGNLPTDTLDEILNDQVAIQRGFTEGVRDDAKSRNKAITAFRNQVGGPLHYQQFIQNSGLTKDQLEMILTGEYMQGIIQKKVQAGVKHSQPEVRASHILLPGTPKGHAQAVKLMHEVQHGASFAALAKKYSTDKGSGIHGGDLGFFPHGQMVGAFDKEAFKLKVGQMGIVHSKFGWHLILVTAHEAKKLTATQYQSALQSAYQNWLAAQKAVLRVQRIVPVSQLPNIATPTPLAGAGVNPQPQLTVQAPATNNLRPVHPTTKKPKTAKKP